MADPFLGEVRLFGFNFPPFGWAFCSGTVLPIAQNQSLYSLLGTTYGGNGRTDFALPDLRSRVPMHRTGFGGAFPQGTKGGEEPQPLTVSEIPSHDHVVSASTDDATDTTPGGNLPATVEPNFNVYGPATNLVSNLTAVGNTGSNQGHDNMQPFLAINFCIALQGTFPPRN